MAGPARVDLRRDGNTVIAVDTNLLVYAHRKESRVHEAAFAIVRALAEGSQAVGDSLALLLRIPECCDIPSGFGKTRQRRRSAPGSSSSPGPHRAVATACVGETDDFFKVALERLVQRPRVRGGRLYTMLGSPRSAWHTVLKKLLTRDRDFSLFPELRKT